MLQCALTSRFLGFAVLNTWFRNERSSQPYNCFKCTGECNYNYTAFNSTLGLAKMGGFRQNDTWSQTVKVKGGNWYRLSYLLGLGASPTSFWRTSVQFGSTNLVLYQTLNNQSFTLNFFSHVFQIVPVTVTNATISFTSANVRFCPRPDRYSCVLILRQVQEVKGGVDCKMGDLSCWSWSC